MLLFGSIAERIRFWVGSGIFNFGIKFGFGARYKSFNFFTAKIVYFFTVQVAEPH